MSWPVSIYIAILSGALGLVCAALISQLCVGWYRISSFEGGSGYFVVFTALLGGMAAFAIGLVVARLMAAGAAPGFIKVLGAALGAVLVIALVALAICRLFADLAPKLDGLALELEIEVRCPRGFAVPPLDEHGALAGVYLPGGRRLPTARLRVDETRILDGRLIVPATVPLTTVLKSCFSLYSAPMLSMTSSAVVAVGNVVTSRLSVPSSPLQGMTTGALSPVSARAPVSSKWQPQAKLVLPIFSTPRMTIRGARVCCPLDRLSSVIMVYSPLLFS